MIQSKSRNTARAMISGIMIFSVLTVGLVVSTAPTTHARELYQVPSEEPSEETGTSGGGGTTSTDTSGDDVADDVTTPSDSGSPSTGSGSSSGGGGGFQPLMVFNEKNETVSLPNSTVSWFTNVAATCTAIYGDTSQEIFGTTYPFGYDSQVMATTSNGTYHTATLTGLTPNVTNYWRPNCTAAGGSQAIAGQQLSIALVQNPSVLGYAAPAQPVEENVKVLGYETLPNTSGDMTRYFAGVFSMFGMILIGLYLGYRRSERT